MFGKARWWAVAAFAILIGTVPAFGQATITSVPYGPVAGYDPGYWGGYYDNAGGYLQGAAAVIRAQGRFMIDNQRANLLKEQVRQARIDTRRKRLDQWLWERDNLPTLQDELERIKREEQRRSINDPPINEIWSSKALNDLLEVAQRIRSDGLASGQKPLDPETLEKINVTSGKAGGNLGLIKEPRIPWPQLLYRKQFEPQRNRLEQLVKQAVNQAQAGSMDAEAIDEMLSEARKLEGYLTEMARTYKDNAPWTFTQYSAAKNFLNQFDASLRALQQPDAGNYLTGKYAARGRTVAELVHNMTNLGMRFAPATPGGEAAYKSLYNALRDYVLEGNPGAALKTQPQ